MVEYKSAPFTEASLVSSLTYSQPNTLEFLKIAKKGLEDILEKDPKDISSNIQLADTHMLLSNSESEYDVALAYLNRAEDLDDGTRESAINYKKAQALFGQDKIAESAEMLDKAIEKDDNHPELFLLKGDLHAKNGEIDQSIKSYHEAVEKYDNNLNKERRINDYISAIKAITRLSYLQQDPQSDFSLPATKRGDVYMNGRKDMPNESPAEIALDSFKIYDEALEILPKNSYDNVIKKSNLESEALFKFSEKFSPEFTFDEMFKYNNDSYSSENPIDYLEDVISTAQESAAAETENKPKAKWHIYAANAMMLKARIMNAEHPAGEYDGGSPTIKLYKNAGIHLAAAEKALENVKLLPEEFAVLQDRKAKSALLGNQSQEGESFINIALQNFNNPRLHYTKAEARLRYGDNAGALKHYNITMDEFLKLENPTREEYFSAISASSRMTYLTDNLQITAEDLVQQGVNQDIFKPEAAEGMIRLLQKENEKIFPD